jgi:hypothetical protein
MASPFPGMDPYLEDPGNWPDFHPRFVVHCREALLAALPAQYIARLGERFSLVDEAREVYLEILHRSDRSLVTAFELLSPANKEAPGRSLYLAKRNALLVRDVHVVELDLLLGGQRLPMHVPLPEGDYHAFVARAERRPDCDVYSWPLPEPLPVLPIPLRAPDPDVLLDLGAVSRTVYERGGYERDIDYALPPPVRFSDERQQWIAGCIKAARGE